MDLIETESQRLVAFIDGTVLGEVNAQLEATLRILSEQQYHLDFEVFAPIKATQDTMGRATKGKDAVVRVQINVYGPRNAAQIIGKALSRQKIYLQNPVHIREGTIYENPHVLKLVGYQASQQHTDEIVEQIAPEKLAPETLEHTIAELYTSLTRGEKLRGLEGDDRLKTVLLL